MKYFKNTELARLYKISEKSVRNWVQATHEGKLNLELYKEGDKAFVANTPQNVIQIEKLVQKGKKYKNTRGIRTISPKKEFYKLYKDREIIEIISNIEIHHETPFQYTYVDGGALDWDRYAQDLSAAPGHNILKRGIELLDINADNIDEILPDNKKINVVDLGPGNGLPIRSTLERLIKQKRLNRYIAIDISQDMLDILKKNISSWFGDAINTEFHLRDISYERFNDILTKDHEEATVNLVFLLGGTLANFRTPSQVLQTINSSLGLNDIFINIGYLDTPQTRRYFDYRPTRKVPIQDGLILELMNIDESLYDVEQVFNREKKARLISVRPKVDLLVQFKLDSGERRLELRKGEPILIWRHWHYSYIEIVNFFGENGFDLLQTVQSKEQNYLLIISRIKRGIELT